MGLDNGLVIKRVAVSEIPKYVKCIKLYTNEVFDNKRCVEVELIYFRKCWGIRDSIMQEISGKDNGRTDISREDILKIISAISPFLVKDYYDNFSSSIWEYEEMQCELLQDIKNLLWLYDYMKKNDKIECYFYDSY